MYSNIYKSSHLFYEPTTSSCKWLLENQIWFQFQKHCESKINRDSNALNLVFTIYSNIYKSTHVCLIKISIKKTILKSHVWMETQYSLFQNYCRTYCQILNCRAFTISSHYEMKDTAGNDSSGWRVVMINVNLKTIILFSVTML